VSGDWHLLLSGRVMVFVLDRPLRERRRLIDILEGLVRHPAVHADDVPRHDSRGRLHHLRFVDGYAVLFWLDHAEKSVHVLEIGLQ
jgi:hypothetical protein